MSNNATIKRTWGPTLLSGLTLITFGAFLLFWQRRTLFSMEIIFSAFLLADGLFHIIKGVLAHDKNTGDNQDDRERDRNTAGILNTVYGLGEILTGAYILWDPSMSTTRLLTIFGIFLLVKAAFDVAFSMMVRMDSNSRMYFVIMGILSLAAGIGALTKPDFDTLRFAMVLGSYGIAAGALSSGLAFRMRSNTDDDMDTIIEEKRKVKVKANLNPAM